MPKYQKQEATKRLEQIAKDYSEKHPKNPMGVVNVVGNGASSMKAVIASYFTRSVMDQILYVIRNTDSDYRIDIVGEKDIAIYITFYQ